MSQLKETERGEVTLLLIGKSPKFGMSTTFDDTPFSLTGTEWLAVGA